MVSDLLHYHQYQPQTCDICLLFFLSLEYIAVRACLLGALVKGECSFTAITHEAPRDSENEALPSLPMPWVSVHPLKLKHSPGMRVHSAG